MSLPAQHRVRADVFPAILTVSPADSPQPADSTTPLSQLHPDSRRIERVRVVVTQDAVYVFQDHHSGPRLIFSERLASYAPPPRPSPPPRGQTLSRTPPRQATLQTDSGKTLAFYRDGSCGCGSRLKGFNPFDSITSYSSTSDSGPLDKVIA